MTFASSFAPRECARLAGKREKGVVMRAVVAYESMYGNTRKVADAIADGLRTRYSVTVEPVNRLDTEQLDTAGLIVIGGPTHVRGMSRASTRKAAEEAANKPGSTLSVERDAQTPGVREWLSALGRLNVQAAVFDTRIKMPAVLSGRASRGIASELRRHGVTMLTKPESFLVTKDNQLLPGEEDRARAWGQQLAQAVAGAARTSNPPES
jgi:menaquinone-dependent protoporphyrinogen IX oxidase